MMKKSDMKRVIQITVKHNPNDHFDAESRIAGMTALPGFIQAFALASKANDGSEVDQIVAYFEDGHPNLPLEPGQRYAWIMRPEGFPLVESKTEGADLAAKFMQELLDAVETLTGIAEEHGARTLADLMFLQQAILNGSFIDHYPGESKVLDITRSLPSGKQWGKFIKVEYMASEPESAQ